jgi:hypothetical protein
MVAEHKIDRQKLISGHNPVLTEIATDAPLTVGNGELAFTADITGMQTLYEEYQELPLCTMSQWGWHTKPVSREKYNYTLDDLVEETTAETESTETAETAKMESENSEAATETTETAAAEAD